MTREALEKLIDATIVPGGIIGSQEYFEDLDAKLGNPFYGEPITAYNAKRVVLMAFDKGLLDQ